MTLSPLSENKTAQDFFVTVCERLYYCLMEWFGEDTARNKEKVLSESG